MLSITMNLLLSPECDQGFYGNKCSSKCSSNCRDGVCDPVNGTCLKGCMSGTTGNSCEKQVHEEKEKRNFHGMVQKIKLYYMSSKHPFEHYRTH